ncbi:hypothetical protein JIN85_14850 [Luteolibacter pohnpeiensis]|uniref:Uncharacterized protein n=1 Tax=Luteolibacter pohnpeiensis TaxID=454153 RepID=A0A934S9G5_9BACT|nr:hypothetical protein [Luteolibacter pohnpeiensis]MBK1883694.1 hypothetical protein [Luteolibacter pohnpeiensis]
MSEENEETNELPGNMFAKVLGEISHGDLASQASEEMANLVKAVSETNKSGSLTLVISVKPRGHDSGQVELAGELKPKCPIKDVAPSMFFTTEHGQLVRDNPRQKQFQFGEPKAVKPSASNF